MKRIFILISASILLASCVTGGFNENPQLDDLNNALAKAPKIDEIRGKRNCAGAQYTICPGY